MQKTKTNNSLYYLLVFILSFLVSCDAKQEYDQYQTIAKGKWNKNNAVTFVFPVNDTLTQKNLFINLRNNKNYPFSNLFLITEMSFPDGNIVADTLEYDMTDVTGKFLGEGFTDIKENKLFYKENITFPKTGNYSLKVRHAMRKSNAVDGLTELKGVTDIGFRIEKTE